MALLDVRKGMPPVKLPRAEFERRYRSRFVDPAFKPLQTEVGTIVAAVLNVARSGRHARARNDSLDRIWQGRTAVAQPAGIAT